MSKKIFTSLKVFAVMVGATVLAISVVYGATTIGTNITTTGTLNVTGLSTMTNATSSAATTTAYLYVGYDVTEPGQIDFSGGDLIVSGDTYLGALATATTGLWVGSGGTLNEIGMTGGDLYVQDDAEVDGILQITHSATSSQNMYATNFVSSGYVTSTSALYTRGANIINGRALASTTIDLATSTSATTSVGIFARAHANGVATSTIGIGDAAAANGGIGGCLEMVKKDTNQYFYCFINSTSTFICLPGRCVHEF